MRKVTWVKILNEVPTNRVKNWQLCFQEWRYYYATGGDEEGYRFIWRRPDGNLQPARGQARIPSKHDLEDLLNQAAKEGWYK